MSVPLDLHSREFQEDPAPTLAWLRHHDPVHRSHYGYWLLTSYDDVAAAFRDPRLSSEWSKKGSLPGMPARTTPDATDPFTRAQQVVLHSFNMKDPPAHTRIRQLVQQAFTRAAVDEQRPRITQLVDELLDAGLAAGSLDVVTELAFPHTITIASEMLGIPSDARDEFRASFEATERLGDPTATPEVCRDHPGWPHDLTSTPHPRPKPPPLTRPSAPLGHAATPIRPISARASLWMNRSG